MPYPLLVQDLAPSESPPAISVLVDLNLDVYVRV